ncbi:RNA 2',3'-cyclic phosphodiesterase [Paenibacillus crassostreae]|uniref:Phosphoesterase HXTX domain-containing protein n=1 Tax=Paenibacillus crassostreae TaxID=1763538 RepID=A0A167DRB1_9BACL|nr:RNA 2',3'-cyclic phosphodiesterase [Paenibacillus crassostreae]OAB74689.1 hypothetical protein PNBC_11665 [Paenibacillus crassostreae]
MHPQDYHITIQFLGETTPEQMGGLQTVLSSINEQPLSLKLNGAGFFGSSKAPRILWAGVSGNLTGLNNLHASVIQATHQCGFIVEERRFAAHITLARNYVGEHEFNVEAIQSAPIGVGWKADRFTLMSTHMNASPMYEIIESYPLNLRF